jgi:hypothetical protein
MKLFMLGFDDRTGNVVLGGTSLESFHQGWAALQSLQFTNDSPNVDVAITVTIEDLGLEYSKVLFLAAASGRKILGGLAAIPGAPVSIWCATKGWDKTRQRALYQPFIMFMQIVALLAIPAMLAGGSAKVGFPSMVYLYVPAGLIGTVIGFAWFRQMTGRQFHIAVNLLLAVSGAGLLL